jgi:endonuclease/exonuclease/phosphatase family metal-dependent hydrolase
MNLISVMSYNIWFDEMDREKRLQSLLETIEHNNPDIICLQEVTAKVGESLIENLAGTYKYVYPNKICLSYGCMIFSRYKITHCNERDYAKTMMGRKLHYIIIEHGSQKLVIATSHFESDFKKKNDVKITQYIEARNILNDLYYAHGPIILCSDTNILPHEEKYFITEDKYWYDTWRESGSDCSIEYTYDTKLNINLKNRGIRKEIRSRIDRIIYRGNNILVPLNFKLIKGSGDRIEPSDHFGIMSEFEILNNKIEI